MLACNCSSVFWFLTSSLLNTLPQYQTRLFCLFALVTQACPSSSLFLTVFYVNNSFLKRHSQKDLKEKCPEINSHSSLRPLPRFGLRVSSPCCMCGMSSTMDLASSLHLSNLFELWSLLLSIHPELAAVTKLIIHHSPCCFCAKLTFLCIQTPGPRPPSGKHHQGFQHMQTTAMGMLPLLSCPHWVRAEYPEHTRQGTTTESALKYSRDFDLDTTVFAQLLPVSALLSYFLFRNIFNFQCLS